MANEPERPIETLLHAAAKKRRDEAGAPFELHPADRRVLQGEVARRFAKPERGVRWLPYRLARLWPICVGAVGIIAVLGMAIWLLMPVTGNERSEMSLAQNQTLGDTEAAKLPSSPSVASPAMTPPPPGPGLGEMPGGLASAETPPPGRASEIRQLNELPPQLAKDATVASDQHEAREKLGLAASAQLADQEKKAPMQLAAPGGASSLAPAGSVSGAFAERYGLAGNPAPPAALPSSPAPPPVVAAKSTAPSVALATASAKPTDDRAYQAAAQYQSPATVALATQSASPPAAVDGLSGLAAYKAKGVNAFANSQRFVQSVPATNAQATFADKVAPARPVLASFQLQQAGTQLQIVDGDGSVYSGSVGLEDAVRRVRSAKAEAPAAALAARAPAEAPAQSTASSLDSDRPASQNYAFRVAGTNLSLNQRVVFTGNLVPDTNLAVALQASTNRSLEGGQGGAQNAPAQQGLLQLNNSRISGKVVIGTGQAVEVNALPASP